MKWMYKIFSWIVALVLPVVIILSVVRLLINPWYPAFEYRTPGFPDDPYGFTLQERLKYAKYAVNYLVNSSDISYLGDLHFPDGQQAPENSCLFMSDCTRLYNERELGHMVDVKNVVSAAIKVLVIGLSILILFAVWAWSGKWLEDYLRGIERGGIIVLAIIGIIILFVIIAFNKIFVLFHEIFFTSGTWSFLYSDTLIRLFPERFWQDTFLMVGGLSFALGLLSFFVGRKFRLRVATKSS